VTRPFYRGLRQNTRPPSSIRSFVKPCVGSHVSLFLSLSRFLFRHITRGTEPGPSYHEKPPLAAVAFCVRTAAGSPVNNRFSVLARDACPRFSLPAATGLPRPWPPWISWMGVTWQVSVTRTSRATLLSLAATPYSTFSVPPLSSSPLLWLNSNRPPSVPPPTKSSLETGCHFVWHFRKWQWVQGHFTSLPSFSGHGS